jgi:TolB-like protein
MSLFSELKRRNVFRMGGAYLARGLVVTQVTATVAPALEMPDWTLKLVVWLGIVGFPVVIAFAWAYELTPEGIRRERDVPASAGSRHVSAQRLDYITIGIVAVALLFFAATRLLAPARDSAQPASDASASAAASERSIAVLPFDNFSADPAQAYFADGITEDLITDLSRLPGLMVIARHSSFAYKGKQVRPQQVAKELGIRYLLEGSVQRQGDRLRINAQLIDAIGGKHLWADRYSGTLDDVFALQDKVIGQIVAALQLELPDTAGRSETSNPAAYDAPPQGLERHGRAARRRRSRQLKRLSGPSHSIRTTPALTHCWRLRIGRSSRRSGTWPPAPDTSAPTKPCRSISRSPCAHPHRRRAR